MAKPWILFDLDGTLTDSGEGIIKCARLALSHFGIYPATDAEMRVFVGPPLRDTFAKFGVPDDGVEEAVRIYRSRYQTVGKYENTPYHGIRALLSRLHDEGYRLFVATSKPEDMAIDILEHFDMSAYFDLICGAVRSADRDSKEKVISYLLSQAAEGQAPSRVIMVGDTSFDVIGANAHGIPTVGVAWGYGKPQDMMEAGAVAVAENTQELYGILTQHFSPSPIDKTRDLW